MGDARSHHTGFCGFWGFWGSWQQQNAKETKRRTEKLLSSWKNQQANVDNTDGDAAQVAKNGNGDGNAVRSHIGGGTGSIQLVWQLQLLAKLVMIGPALHWRY